MENGEDRKRNGEHAWGGRVDVRSMELSERKLGGDNAKDESLDYERARAVATCTSLFFSLPVPRR